VTQTLPVGTAQPRGPVVGPLTHMAGAGLLGIVGTFVGAPAVIAGLFGGWPAILGAVAVVTAVVAAAAVALDTAVGPDRGGRAGSIARGLTLGVGGSLTVAVLAFVGLYQDLDGILPVPLRYAAAALPFVAIAGLQWRGAVRISTAVVLVATAAVVGVPRALDTAQQHREADIVTEVGTTARPWVTRIEGLDARAPQTTGSGYLWSASVDDGGTPIVQLLRMPDEMVPDGDPCTGGFYTPEGDFPVTSCRTADGGTWLRSSDPYWQQLVRRVDGTWLGATAKPDVPESLLEEALRNARPMTDDEYDDWLDAVLPSPSGH
jgi:hypothetical protein